MRYTRTFYSGQYGKAGIWAEGIFEVERRIGSGWNTFLVSPTTSLQRRSFFIFQDKRLRFCYDYKLWMIPSNIWSLWDVISLQSLLANRKFKRFCFEPSAAPSSSFITLSPTQSRQGTAWSSSNPPKWIKHGRGDQSIVSTVICSLLDQQLFQLLNWKQFHQPFKSTGPISMFPFKPLLYRITIVKTSSLKAVSWNCVIAVAKRPAVLDVLSNVHVIQDICICSRTNHSRCSCPNTMQLSNCIPRVQERSTKTKYGGAHLLPCLSMIIPQTSWRSPEASNCC